MAKENKTPNLQADNHDTMIPKPCYTCSGKDFWRLNRPGKIKWVCNFCHPVMPGLDVVRTTVEPAK